MGQNNYLNGNVEICRTLHWIRLTLNFTGILYYGKKMYGIIKKQKDGENIFPCEQRMEREDHVHQPYSRRR